MHLLVHGLATIEATHRAETVKRVESLAAEAAAQSLRRMDSLGLWAPGVFVGVLPKCTEPAAKIVMHRVLAAAPASIRLADGERLAVELAAGIAVLHNGDRAEDLIKPARRAGEGSAENSGRLQGGYLPI